MPRKYKSGHTQARNFKHSGNFNDTMIKRYKGKADPQQTELTRYIKKEKGKKD